MASGKIYTNEQQITDALGQVKGVVRSIDSNITDLKNMTQALLNEFQGAGSEGFKGTAEELMRRLSNCETSIDSLDRATEQAATQIKTADANVAKMFSNIV
jgi:WXG100 family type VII secretion target